MRAYVLALVIGVMSLGSLLLAPANLDAREWTASDDTVTVQWRGYSHWRGGSRYYSPYYYRGGSFYYPSYGYYGAYGIPSYSYYTPGFSTYVAPAYPGYVVPSYRYYYRPGVRVYVGW